MTNRMKGTVGTLLGLMLVVMTSATQAAIIKMDFTVTGFDISNGNAAPTNPVSGSILWQAESVNSSIDFLIGIDLTTNGFTYSVGDLGFISPFGGSPVSHDIIGRSNRRGVTGIANLTNDFTIQWDPLALTGANFTYASATLSGIWRGTNFTSFSISEVPLPGTFALLCSGLAGLVGISRRKRA